MVYQFLKKLNGLEESHSIYSSKYLYSLINSGKINQAFNFSKKIERKKQDSFESDLIIGLYYLKTAKLELAKKYFLKAKERDPRSLLDSYIANTLLVVKFKKL